MIFNMTGGGAPLNFKVVGGTTEPSNPKENTIWINTDKEITGWHFDSQQPENMKNGEVWFSTGKASTVEFNALKANTLMVFPLSAKQMVSGTLVKVTAKCYQGGKWVEFIGENQLFYYGKQKYTWSAIGIKKGDASNQSAVAPTVSTNSDGSVTVTRIGGDANRGGYIMDELIDLSSISKIKMHFSMSSYDGLIETGITILPPNYTYQADFLARIEVFSQTNEVSLDVSNVSGKAYVFIPIFAKTGTFSITITEVYWE